MKQITTDSTIWHKIELSRDDVWNDKGFALIYQFMDVYAAAHLPSHATLWNDPSIHGNTYETFYVSPEAARIAPILLRRWKAKPTQRPNCRALGLMVGKPEDLVEERAQ